MDYVIFLIHVKGYNSLLNVQNLNVTFNTRKGEVEAVKDISFNLKKGEILGIVGESGSGKSVTSYALMKILDNTGVIKANKLIYSGIDLENASEQEMMDIRGREVSMIFQNPRTSLNPIRKIGKQIEDVLKRHSQANRYNAKQKAIEALKAVKIKDPENRYYSYPYELSGGMCQRVVCAIALACDPRLLIADEPTTGLDITTQKAVMDLIKDLITSRNMSSIFITHDLGLASEYCDRIIVMKDGHIVEKGITHDIFTSPNHPYTRKLVYATPRPGKSIRSLLPSQIKKKEVQHTVHEETLLEVKNLSKFFPGQFGPVQAVKNINFKIKKGECVGLVGESGCGKSTTSAILSRLIDASEGKIIFNKNDISTFAAKNFSKNSIRSDIQMVFQDPTESLNPRYTTRQSISDPLKNLTEINSKEINSKVIEVSNLVGLPLNLLDRLPHQLSGGQKARVGIARAIVLSPKILILDEPTASLDVSIQAIILNLLVDLRAKLGMSYLFVSHDLHVVQLLCDYIIVMKEGVIIEQGNSDQIISSPKEDYTKSLLAASPKPPKLPKAS